MKPTDEEIRKEADKNGYHDQEMDRLYQQGFMDCAKWMREQTDNKWISVDERLPLAFQTGNWDGKKSEPVLVKTKDNRYFVAITYQGTMDGNEFCDWYDDRDFEIKDVQSWKEI